MVAAITKTPWKNVGSEPTNHIKAYQSKLLKVAKSNQLSEQVLPGDGDGSSWMQFLGSGNDIPFLLVKATKDAPTASSSSTISQQAHSVVQEEQEGQDAKRGTTNNSMAMSEDGTIPQASNRASDQHEAVTSITKRASRSSIPNQVPNNNRVPEPRPQALLVTLELDADCFLKLPSNLRENGKLGKLFDKRLDIKVDVFLNGVFEGSEIIPARLKKSERAIKQTYMFHGHRVTRLQEVPWLLVPAGQNADGTMRDLKRTKGGEAGTQQRWDTINENLRNHASSLTAYKGEPSILCQYLHQVASMLPPRDSQRPGGLKFAVIDVVISNGRGQKDPPTTPYMLQPTPNRLAPLPTSYKAPVPKRRAPILDNADWSSPCKDVKARPNAEPSSSPLSNTRTEPFDFTTPERPSSDPAAIRRRHLASHENRAIDQTQGYTEATSKPDASSRGRARFRALPASSNHFNQLLSSQGSHIDDSPLRKKQKISLVSPNHSPSYPLDNPFDNPVLANSPSTASISRRSIPPQNFGPMNKMPQKTFTGNLSPEKIERRRTRLSAGSPVEIAYLTESERIQMVEHEAAQSVAGSLKRSRSTYEEVRADTGSSPVRRGRGRLAQRPVTPEIPSEEHGSRVVVLPFADKTKLANFPPTNDSTGALRTHDPTTASKRPPRKLVEAPKGSTQEGNQKAQVETASKWKHSPLSEDCVVTYAKDSVRQIRAERGGQFQEAGILLGVRFILG